MSNSSPGLDDRAGHEIPQLDVAIAGGGIAGMYCAYKLRAKIKPQSIGLFEASERLGGRIWTTSIVNSGNETEFYAEFGAMRIEPQHQCLLKQLLKKIMIPAGSDKTQSNSAYLVDFAQHDSPVGRGEPTYELVADEQDQPTTLDLLKLGLRKILLRFDQSGQQAGSQQFNKCVDELKTILASATKRGETAWKDALLDWAGDLEDTDYQNIREHAVISGVPLWQMGFWNLLSEVLSNNAINKIRDQGKFFHIISENPNAAEWLIACLRFLKSSGKLQGIRGGTERIVSRLEERLTGIAVNRQHRLTALVPCDNGVLLTFDHAGAAVHYWAEQVILALPKAPLQRLLQTNQEHFADRVLDAADSVFGYPMVKAFFAVKERWWEDKHTTNISESQLPTRELHFLQSALPDSKRGMIMIYTDRPGSAFWANYVGKHGRQDQPECFSRSALRTRNPDPNDIADSQSRRLIDKFLHYLQQNKMKQVRAEDVEWCGIRDWGREPYLGANHAWRPERKSWEELKVLSAFGFNSSESKNVHVCGEAYSDYQGFIEGSLRSAAHVLHKIDTTTFKTKTPRLCECSSCKRRTRARV